MMYDDLRVNALGERSTLGTLSLGYETRTKISLVWVIEQGLVHVVKTGVQTCVFPCEI